MDIRVNMGLSLPPLEVPENLTTPADRARYCRDLVGELLKRADSEQDQNTKGELIGLAERWMTLAFDHQRQAH